jgi:hypothetical protein
MEVDTGVVMTQSAEAEVERVAIELWEADGLGSPPRGVTLACYQKQAGRLLKTHAVIPRADYGSLVRFAVKRYEITDGDPLADYTFVDALGHQLENCVEYRALVRAAQLSDARERERVALAEQCAALRDVAFAVATHRRDIEAKLPLMARDLRGPLERWLLLLDPKTETQLDHNIEWYDGVANVGEPDDFEDIDDTFASDIVYKPMLFPVGADVDWRPTD